MRWISTTTRPRCPPRIIEVKAVGRSQRGWFLPLEAQVNEARTNPDFCVLHRRQMSARDPSVVGQSQP